MFEDTEISETDQTLIAQAEQAIEDMLQSDLNALRFGPMNSFRRRLIHKLGTSRGLESTSIGEGPDRAVCLLRAGITAPADLLELPICPIQVEEPERERERKFSRPPREPREPRPEIPRPAVIDRGFQIFYAKPGSEIVLRSDGSFGVRRQDDEAGELLDEKVVPNGMFRVRNSRIVRATDPEWRTI